MNHYLALTCEAMARSIYASAARTANIVTIQLFRQGLHNAPKKLKNTLQAEIDTVEASRYDAILLVYGMCGNSTVGLTARHTPIVIPRAHDCITLYLGSRDRYQEEFDRHPGTYWYSVDYMERNVDGDTVALGAADMLIHESQYEEYVKKYGVDNADMLMETMRGWAQHYTRAAFIDLDLGESEPYLKIAQEKAVREGWIFERMQGNRRLLEMLVAGNWDEDEYLVIPPGYTVTQSYDDGLVKAVKDQ